ncbi:MAG: acyltransferase [Treponema sp.]|nr:acyltransferase [Treponema sp.]
METKFKETSRISGMENKPRISDVGAKQRNSLVKTQPRSFYLDNLKIFLTVLVIAHHAMIPFTGGEGWPFVPSNADESMPYMWHFLSTNAAFFMGLFFMISGYFVPKSFDRQGFLSFAGKKVLRLFVPFIVLSVIISFAGGTPDSGHAWFLGSLFLFCLIYALARLAAEKFFNKTDSAVEKKPVELSVLFIAVFVLIMGAGSFLIRFFYPQDKWIFLWAFKFEPAHYLQYIMMFIFGVMAGRGNWFEKMSDAFGCTIFIIGILFCIGNYLRGDGFWGGFVYHWFGFYESFLCVTLCTGLVWFFKSFVNWSNKFWQWCSVQAFGAYIVHLFVLLIVEKLLDKIWLGVAGKYFAVVILSAVISFLIPGIFHLICNKK